MNTFGGFFTDSPTLGVLFLRYPGGRGGGGLKKPSGLAGGLKQLGYCLHHTYSVEGKLMRRLLSCETKLWACSYPRPPPFPMRLDPLPPAPRRPMEASHRRPMGVGRPLLAQAWPARQAELASTPRLLLEASNWPPVVASVWPAERIDMRLKAAILQMDLSMALLLHHSLRPTPRHQGRQWQTPNSFAGPANSRVNEIHLPLAQESDFLGGSGVGACL